MEQIMHIFGYLKTSLKRRLFYDPGYPRIPESRFKRHNWEHFYKDAKEELPLDMLEPRGKNVGIHWGINVRSLISVESDPIRLLGENWSKQLIWN